MRFGVEFLIWENKSGSKLRLLSESKLKAPMKWRLFTLAMIAFTSTQLGGQSDSIFLQNPSFEDFARASRTPRAWIDCGFPGESPPDTQPDETFSVSKQAQEGNTYLGMVVRDNDTWESVGQRLSKPMQAGKCYQFSIYLARSELYVSVSRRSPEQKEANYITPAVLQIYGGFDYCDKSFLLAKSKRIINHRWIQYTFKFEPDKDYTHLLFEVFYQTPVLFPYNGNVLLDAASPLVEMPCDANAEDWVAEVKKDEPDTNTPPTPTPPRRDPQPEPPIVNNPIPKVDPVEEEEDITLGGIKASEMREGQTISIDKLYFEADSSRITSLSAPVLDEVYRFLAKNSKMVVEIGGHTNGRPDHSYADKLSTARAKSVAEYLIRKGIDPKRVQFKGYGKREPIASNSTADGRKKNQRVEIKILSFDG